MKKLYKVAVIVSTLAFCTSAFAQTTLKLAHAAPESDIQQNMSLFFKKEVELRSNGNIKVNIFPQGQLGNDKQMIDGTRSGIIDISMVGLNNYSGVIPEAAAFELPFMFPTRAEAYKALDGAPGDEIFIKMAKLNLKGLGYPENGYRNITNNRGPIKEPADLKGLRMRVNDSKALNDMFNELKANPQQLPVAELYSALETGVVDAQDHPLGVTLSFKFYEVQKYLSLTQHAYSPLVVTMNFKKFNKLTPEEQKIVAEVAKEAVDLQRKMSVETESSMIAELESHGMKVNKDVDAAAFQTAAKPAWNSYISANGDAMIKAIQAEVE
jgi:tripartite ATP-independent transporter DctP family solute receptor